MHDPVLRAKLQQLGERVRDKLGLHYPDGRLSDLERGVRAFGAASGSVGVHETVDDLLARPLTDERLDALARHLTIGETYFFRHPEVFSVLEESVIPAFLAERSRERKQASFWCAGCSTGEEAYSLAILLHRLIPDIRNWRIDILATDVNRDCLHKARGARYGRWSFRGLPEEIRRTYFEEQESGETSVAPHIREMVRFEYWNLADETLPAFANGFLPFDFIFCRNVLIYFSQHHIKRIMEMFSRLLRPGGWLVTSPVETSYGAHGVLSLVDFKKAMLFLKEEGPAQKRADPLPQGRFERFDPVKPVAPPSISPTAPMVSPMAAVPTVLVPTTAHKPAVSAPVAAHKPAVSALPDGLAEAVRLHAAGRQSEALAALDREPEGDRVAERAALRARIHADLGSGAEALRWCEKAVDADRVRPESYYLLASIKMEYGDESGGIQALRRALFLNPDFLMAHYTLGTLLLRLGKPSEAEKQLRVAFRLLQPRSADEIVEGSDGLTAGRLRAMIEMLLADRDSKPSAGHDGRSRRS